MHGHFDMQKLQLTDDADECTGDRCTGVKVLIPASDPLMQGVVLPLYISHGCKECRHALHRLPAQQAHVCLY